MRIIFRATADFLKGVRQDLERPHAFAAERVGFISVRAANAGEDLLLLAHGYHPVDDSDYVNDQSVGAMMGQEAIRKALNIALLQPVGMIHVHMHGHRGVPGFSKIDLSEQGYFVPDFFKVRNAMPHGAMVLSQDRAAGRIWLNPTAVSDIQEFNIIGWRYSLFSGLPEALDLVRGKA
jgi:hypothetical protein